MNDSQSPLSVADPPATSVWHLPGKIGYGLLFCLVIPAALAWWGHEMSSLVPWPALHSPLLGAALVCIGLILILCSFDALRRHGKGLPMNAFPPPLYVHQGPYRLTRHPIYAGFAVVCLGVAVAVGSSAGIWIVTPIVMMGCAALVWGHERPDLQRRFGPLVNQHQPLLRLPSDEAACPDWADRLSVYLLVLLPWLILYTSIASLPTPADALMGYFPFEHGLPVIQWTELVYASTYLLVLLAPLLAASRRDLRQFAISGLGSMVIIFSLYLLLPIRSPARGFIANGSWGRLLLLERHYDAHGAEACPSYHVFWALLAAMTLSRRGAIWRVAAPLWAIAIAVSCLTTGQHALIDVLTAVCMLPIVLLVPRGYVAAVRVAQHLGNSFHARSFGPLRIVNHCVYSGLAALVGMVMIIALAGPGHMAAIAAISLCSVVGAALWAQLIEGSPRLLRPFGYYGAIVGGVIGSLFAPLFGSSILLVAAAFASAAPAIQAIGRLRCLVQGCCHGRPLSSGSAAELGLCITNPSSRVCRLSPFAHVPIHPTPLYSILGNLLIGLALLRLWMLHAPLVILIGLYLIFAGLARFVEEAYRGEPQTRRLAGLPEYQWYAIASVVAGMMVTALPVPAAAPALNIRAALAPVPMGAAIAIGLFTALAMSMDFPRWNCRFARLTG